jgi:glycosyltransferase involved in cell wall biosynthesis
MKKIKILYTIPNFDTAGSGKVLYDLAKGLDKEKFEVSIACRNSKGSFFSEIEKLGVPIFFIETSKPLRPYSTLYFRIKPFINFLKQHQFDLVHSWNWSSDWSEVLATRLSGAKFIYTKKAMSWGNIHWKIKSYLAHFIITINEEMKSYFSYKKSQKLISLGLDINYYTPNLFSRNLNTSDFKIITVANLVAVKGIEVLIEAIHKLRNSKIHLEILGNNGIEILEDGSEYDYYGFLQELVSDLNMANQVTFLGGKKDVRPFLVNSDLYVIPTLNKGRKEGMPMALVEAMAMGVPVLGSNISGINFVLKDFPTLQFNAGDSDDLSQKIHLFYKQSDDEKNQLGKKLRDYCIHHFSAHTFVKLHEDLYVQLMKNKS